jgi:hypothetical protein
MKLPSTLRFLPIALGLAVSGLGLLAPAGAQAAPAPYLPVTSWGSATTVSGDLNVLTTGSLIYGYNFGSTSVTDQTVNGVTFSAFGTADYVNSKTVGSVTVAESPGVLEGLSSLGSASAPFSGLGTSYQSLLSTGITANNPATMTVVLGGLTTGTDYTLQVWISDASGSRNYSTRVSGGSSGNITVDLDPNVTNTAGGLGQYVIGTFTASATAHRFTLDSLGVVETGPLINALQLRTYAPAAVPLPATLGLLLAALPVLAGLSRARRQA